MAHPAAWVLAIGLLTQGRAAGDPATQQSRNQQFVLNRMGGGPLFSSLALSEAGPAGPRGGVHGDQRLADTIGKPTDPGPGPISTIHGRDLSPKMEGLTHPPGQQPTMKESQKGAPILDSVRVDLQARTLTMHWRGKVTSAYSDIRLDGQIAFVSPPEDNEHAVVWLGSGSAVIRQGLIFVVRTALPDTSTLAVRLSDADMAAIARSCPMVSSINQTFLKVTDQVLQGAGGVSNQATDVPVPCTGFTRGPLTELCCETHADACDSLSSAGSASRHIPESASSATATTVADRFIDKIILVKTTARPRPPAASIPTFQPAPAYSEQRAHLSCTSPASRSVSASQPAAEFALDLPAVPGAPVSSTILLNTCSQSQNAHFVNLAAAMLPGMTFMASTCTGESIDSTDPASIQPSQAWLYLDSADAPRVLSFTVALIDPESAGPDETITMSVNCPLIFVFGLPQTTIPNRPRPPSARGVIASVVPSSGSVGTVVSIKGTGLRSGGNVIVAVQFAGVNGTIVHSSDTLVVVRVRSRTPVGTVDIVLLSDMSDGEVRAVDRFTVLPLPQPTAGVFPTPPPSFAPFSVRSSATLASSLPQRTDNIDYTSVSPETTAPGEAPRVTTTTSNALTVSPAIAYGTASGEGSELVPVWVAAALVVVAAITTGVFCVAGKVRQSKRRSAGVSGGTRSKQAPPNELIVSSGSSLATTSGSSDKKESGSGPDSESGKKSKRQRRLDDLSSEQWQQCLQEVSERVFDRLCTSTKADENSAAVILQRIRAGAHADDEQHDKDSCRVSRNCFLVQRTDGSKSKYQVQTGPIRMVAQKALYLAYHRFPLVDVEPVQIRQTCTYPDGTWWCLEPTHLDRTVLKRVSPFIIKHPIPEQANALLPNGKVGQKLLKGAITKLAKSPKAQRQPSSKKALIKLESGVVKMKRGVRQPPGASLPFSGGLGQPGLASDGAAHWQDLHGGASTAPLQQLPTLPANSNGTGTQQTSVVSLAAAATLAPLNLPVSSLTGMGGYTFHHPVQPGPSNRAITLPAFALQPIPISIATPGQLFDPAAARLPVMPTSAQAIGPSQLYENEVEMELSSLMPGSGPSGGVTSTNIDEVMAKVSAYPIGVAGVGTAVTTAATSNSGHGARMPAVSAEFSDKIA